MKLNRTGANWDRLERNKINENWDIIEGLDGKVDNIVDEISDEAFEKIVDSAKINWKEPVDSFNDLPSEAGEGETRMVRDTGKVYRYNGSEWQEIQEIDATAINEVDSRLTQQLEEKADQEYLVRVESDLEESLYFDEITYEKYRDYESKTDYFISHIPHFDKEGNVIQLKHDFQNGAMNSGVGETVRSFADRRTTSLAINASIWNENTGLIYGIQIKDGEILQDTPHSDFYTLGIKDDNTLVAYPPTVTAETILSEGCNNALTGFYPLIENGLPTSQSHSGFNDKHPRQVIAQLHNKDIVILTVEGRWSFNEGMTAEDCVRILTERDVKFAYMLDGGGSTSTVVKGLMINNPVDDSGREERKVADFLYVKKDTPYNAKAKSVSKGVGDLGHRISVLSAELKNIREFYKSLKLVGNEGEQDNRIESWEGDERQTKLDLRKEEIRYLSYLEDKLLFRARSDGDAILGNLKVSSDGTIKTDLGIIGNFFRFAERADDLDAVTRSGIYWANASVNGIPSVDGYGGSWIILNVRLNSSNALMIAFQFKSGGSIYTRRTSSSQEGVWLAWDVIETNNK